MRTRLARQDATPGASCRASHARPSLAHGDGEAGSGDLGLARLASPGGLGRLRRAAGVGRSPQGCRDPGGDPGAEEVLGGVALALQPVTGFP